MTKAPMMDESEIALALIRTQRQILDLLMNLETQTERKVDSAALVRLDVTMIQDEEPQSVTSFEIRLLPPPGEE